MSLLCHQRRHSLDEQSPFGIRQSDDVVLGWGQFGQHVGVCGGGKASLCRRAAAVASITTRWISTGQAA